jgi:hypothetical protein
LPSLPLPHYQNTSVYFSSGPPPCYIITRWHK